MQFAQSTSSYQKPHHLPHYEHQKLSFLTLTTLLRLFSHQFKIILAGKPRHLYLVLKVLSRLKLCYLNFKPGVNFVIIKLLKRSPYIAYCCKSFLMMRQTSSMSCVAIRYEHKVVQPMHHCGQDYNSSTANQTRASKRNS